MGFVLARRAVLEASAGNAHSLAMDLHDQWAYMVKTTQWRYTPPTHVVAALDEALKQFWEEGGVAARGARYMKNCRELISGMSALGFRSFLPAAIQAPIIVTFHAPADSSYEFKRFYAEVKRRGYILYPGKLTQVETFRVGCMGHFGDDGIGAAVNAISATLKALGITRIAPQKAA
jgi:2-aminoethylphosphonate-pyruvate transaminase